MISEFWICKILVSLIYGISEEGESLDIAHLSIAMCDIQVPFPVHSACELPAWQVTGVTEQQGRGGISGQTHKPKGTQVRGFPREGRRNMQGKIIKPVWLHLKKGASKYSKESFHTKLH